MTAPRYHRTRFAPAPTGYLHLGHVANALMVFGTARCHGSEVLLRIEDHDRQRCRPEYEAALLDDLDWLGFRPGQGTTDEFRRGRSPFRQSDNGDRYARAVDRLRARGHHVFACACSRRELASVAGDAPDQETPYAGRCRHLGLAPGPGRGLRLELGPGVETFTDLALGPRQQDPAAQCGDLLLRDRLGNWTYQFAVVVDDLAQEVDLVVRGRDLLDSTGRQLRLARLLGRERPPAFLHHELLRRPDGSKLSKADGATGIRELRAAGATPADVLGSALHALGRWPGRGPIPLAEALALVSA